MNWITKVLAPLISLFLIISAGQLVLGQSSWEGSFMDQFRVELTFDGLGSGTIKMFDGPAQIQNDGLIKVVIEEREISFYIPAKQTDFSGQLGQGGQQIVGNFIFPDGSQHPITINKVGSTEGNSMAISRTEAAADLRQLYSVILETHPEPFRYISRTEFEALFSSVSRLEGETLSLTKFYLEAARLTDGVRCSHTGLRLPAEITAGIEHTFPLEIFYDNENLYVLKSPTSDIPVGSLILSINDKPVEEILAELKLFVPINGFNTTTKPSIINRKFSAMLPLIDNAKEYRILFRNELDKELTVVAGPKLPLNEPKANVIFEQRSEEVAYLKIPSFGISDMDEYFANLESIFTELTAQNTKNLVLDLRDNSGGHPIFAAQLLSYLTSQEFTYFKKNPEIAHFEPLYHPMQANEKHFTGNLYVFVNGGCLSTSGHLISLLKEYSQAKFIGEQPGSTYTCNDFSKKIILENSTLELNLPTTRIDTDVEGMAKEVPFPIDFEVTVTLADKLSGKDVYWETLKTAIIPHEVY